MDVGRAVTDAEPEWVRHPRRSILQWFEMVGGCADMLGFVIARRSVHASMRPFEHGLTAARAMHVSPSHRVRPPGLLPAPLLIQPKGSSEGQ